MLERLEGSPLGDDLARISDRVAMAAYVNEVASACRARGIAFSAFGAVREAGP